jgi:hypothetical protein
MSREKGKNQKKIFNPCLPERILPTGTKKNQGQRGIERNRSFSPF